MKKTSILLLISAISLILYSQQPQLSIIANNMNADTVYICYGTGVSLYATGLLSLPVMADFNNILLPPSIITNFYPIFDNPCGSAGADGTPYLWVANANNPRSLSTVPMAVDTNTEVCFDLRMAVQGDASPCEGPDEVDEGVSLQYSTDNGINWIDIAYFCPDGVIYQSNIWGGSSSAGGGSGTPFNSWANYCFPLPSGAAGSNTMIRWYQDFVTDVSYDHWGLDNISISNYSGQLIWYENGSVLTSGTNPPVQYPVYDTQYSVEASDSTGTYYDTIFVSVDQYGPVDISGLQSHYCPGSPADTFAISPLNTDVTGPGVSGNIFDPAAAGAGNHIIQMMLEQDVTNYYEAANVPFWTDDFSTDKGWTGYGQGGWERDSTRISSGCGGYQCPVNDHSSGNDNYIIGTFIGDCYTELDTVYWLESPTIDCSGKQNCVLSLYSCSGFGSGDTAIISVFDGTGWTDIAGQSGFLNQSVWQLAMYNVSAFADNNPDFRLRFGIGPADTISFYKGWNIDDVKILANGMVNDTTTCVYTEYFAIEVDTTGLQQDICIVTVDQALQKNRIIWEKTDPYAEVYFVYKETTYAGVYDLIGTIPATSPGEFTDTSSVPYQQSARYCLAGIDSCGNVSDMGPAHKTIHLNVSPALPQGYSLTWEHYEGFSFDTYIIYRGDSYATLDSIQSVAYGTGIFTYTDMNPPAGVIYYMIAAVKNTPCDPNTTAKSMRQQCNMACSNIRDNGYSGIPDVKPLSVNIIPNPTDGGFYINIDQAGRNVEIIIRDVKGLVIYQDQYLTSGRNFKEYIDLPLTAGVYSVQVVSEDRISVRKLVVQ